MILYLIPLWLVPNQINVLFKDVPALKLITITKILSGCKGMAPYIANIGTRWGWVVNFTLRTLKTRGKGSRRSSRRRLEDRWTLLFISKLLLQFFILYETLELNYWISPSHIVYISDNRMGQRFIVGCSVIVCVLVLSIKTNLTWQQFFPASPM